MNRRVLLADDDITTLTLLEDALRDWDYDVILAPDGEKAWDILQSENPPHLMVLDWMMPGMDGVEVCRRLRALQNRPYTYIVLLTSKSEKDDIVAGLDAGADDYLTKPVDMGEFKCRLAVGRRILDYERELAKKNELLQKANEDLARMACTDYLTGLYNRRFFMQRLEEETSQARRHRLPMCVAILDLDHFKQVNDTYGHLTGDAVLRRFAELIQQGKRLSDIVGRYGGEEFCILLPQTDIRGGAIAAGRFRSACESEEYSDSEGRHFRITCSIGIAELGEDIPQAEKLLQRADDALYQAKEQGRNQVCLAPSLGPASA